MRQVAEQVEAWFSGGHSLVGDDVLVLSVNLCRELYTLEVHPVGLGPRYCHLGISVLLLELTVFRADITRSGII
jgi:hypothetical protein